MYVVRLAVAALLAIWAYPATAERVCIEEAAGVCLKYRTVEPETRRAPPSQPPRASAAPAAPATPEARAEASLNLTRNEYRLVQGGLQASGHYNGALDGVMGGGSRGALRAWQRANGAPATGYLTFDQVLALQERRPLTAAVPSAPAIPPVAAAPAAAPAAEAAPPEHPKAGQTYREVWMYTGDSTFGDIIATVKRTSETQAELTLQLVAVNNVGDSFTKTCAVTIGEEFSCPAGPRRYPPWSVGGNLPELTVNGKTVTFW